MKRTPDRIDLFDILIGELSIAIDDDALTERKQMIRNLLRVLLPASGIWYEPQLGQVGRDGKWYVLVWLVPHPSDPRQADLFIETAAGRAPPPSSAEIQRDVVTAAQAAMRRLVALKCIAVGRLQALEDEAWFQHDDLRLIRLLAAFPMRRVVLRRNDANFVLTAAGKMGGAMVPAPITIECVVHMIGHDEARLRRVKLKHGPATLIVPDRLSLEFPPRSISSKELVTLFEFSCLQRNRRVTLEVLAEARPSDRKLLKVYWFCKPIAEQANWSAED